MMRLTEIQKRIRNIQQTRVGINDNVVLNSCRYLSTDDWLKGNDSWAGEWLGECVERLIWVTSFSSIPYYSNVRLISKMYLEQNSCSITLDFHASTNEHPPHLFLFKPHSANKISCHLFYKHAFLPDLVLQTVFEPDFLWSLFNYNNFHT